MTGSHVKIGFLALCLALLLAIPTAWIAHVRGLPGPETIIALEHDRPVTLRILRLVSSGAHVFEISHGGSGSIALHVPDAWKRQEVRGVPLASVTSDAEDWNFVRWVIPRGATVRFDAPHPGRVTLHNPSGIPVTVRTTVVHVGTNTREDDATIVTTDPYPLP